MQDFNLREYARRGAVTRLVELNAELEAILGEFPELKEGAATHRRRGRPAKTTRALNQFEMVATASKSSRKRRVMSAAQRKAVSEWMRKYWAGRRKAAVG